MKEFLEKRWWGGVGVIIALMLGLPALIQYFGKVNISWLAVTIALNIILIITLVLVAVWNTKLKRKYEDANSRLEKAEVLLKKLAEKPKRQRVFLLDPNYIWKLKIDNSLLTELHGQAHGLATAKFQDVKLIGVSLIVYPYQSINRVSILFMFYSRWADRRCTYIINELRDDIDESTPSHPVKDEIDRVTFAELPWLRDPNWPQFIRKSCEKVGPLSPAEWTNYHLSIYAWRESQWSLSFEDGVTGKKINFSWDGKGEPIPEEHNRGV